MNITITGGAGYVGTTLIPLLLSKGYNIKVLDNLMFGGDQLLPFFRNTNFEFQKGDIRNKEDVKKAIEGADVIIHLAAIVGYPACRKDPQLAESVNVDGTKMISSLASKDQLILFGSTGSNYGSVEEICTEETPLHPLSLYGQTKTIAEAHLMEHNTAIAYRFATAFGVSPRMRLDLLINDFTYKALSQGYLVVYESHFIRTFIHVTDMARAFLFAIENQDKMRGEVFNVGSENLNYSKRQICELISKRTNAYVNYADVGEDADKRNYVVSYDKISNLGYSTTITVEDGIDELIKALAVVDSKTRYTNV